MQLEENMEHVVSVQTPELRPSQLRLPFSEGQPIAERKLSSEEMLESFRIGIPLQRDLLCGLKEITGQRSQRLQMILDYLLRDLPDFVLQHRAHSNGNLQLTLYRIPDGTFYRINVTASFLDRDLAPEQVINFLEANELRQKLSASALSPIVIDADGILLPDLPVQQEEEKGALWAKLRSTLVFTLKHDSLLWR
jgi:hypothetical protein